MRQFTAVIERDEDWYVALCPELDIASQGRSVEEARRNLIEAIELFFEAASPSEIQERIRSHPLGDICDSGGCPRCPGCGDYLQDCQSFKDWQSYRKERRTPPLRFQFLTTRSCVPARCAPLFPAHPSKRINRLRSA